MVNENSRLLLTCEYLEQPLGVQNEFPRFSWKVVGVLEASKQVSARVVVWDGGELMWDSGRMETARNTAVQYEGKSLKSRRRYQWDVEVEVEPGEGLLKASSFFETGLFKGEDWHGEWIAPAEERRGEVPLIRKVFDIAELPEVSRLYVCGLGYCETTINGKRIGDSRLDPGWTDYNKTVLYRVYDVGSYLKKGKNVICFELGEGWHGLEHNFFVTTIGKLPSWNSRPRLLCNLYLDEKCIATKGDADWKYSWGPIVENNIYDGEVYDGRREKKGWMTAEYYEDTDCGEWKAAICAVAPTGRLQSQLMPPIKEICRRKPAYMEYIGEDEDYSMVIDYGQNMTGWVELVASGRPGAKIIVRYAEILNHDGTVNQRNLRSAKSREEYIIGEEGSHRYRPQFTYHGFRYVSVEMEPGTFIYSADAVQVSTAIRKITDFDCSDEYVKRIYETVMRTEENNIHSVPTDCPQRDERLGWVNDMTVRHENAIYNYDMVLVYEKWMRDLQDAQAENGAIPDTAPYFFGGRPGSHITSAFVLIPWCLYGFTNDKQMLERYFNDMKRYVNFKLGERTEEGILPECYFGEWVPPMTEAVWGWGENAVPKDIPQQLITTCYLYYDCLIMKKISETLGKTEEAHHFEVICKEIAEAVNRKYYRPEGYYEPGTQGANIMPLFLDIVPDGGRNKVLQHLMRDIAENRNMHLATGNQMTKIVYDVLVKEGMADFALELTTQKTYPSIGYMLEQGATTIWERWENLTINHMNSHDHPMLGAFSVWLLKGLAGLRLVHGNTQQYVIHPIIPQKLNYVRMERELAGGICRISWEKTENNGVKVELKVPWNTTVYFETPAGYHSKWGERIALESGNYSFELEAVTA